MHSFPLLNSPLHVSAWSSLTSLNLYNSQSHDWEWALIEAIQGNYDCESWVAVRRRTSILQELGKHKEKEIRDGEHLILVRRAHEAAVVHSSNFKFHRDACNGWRVRFCDAPLVENWEPPNQAHAEYLQTICLFSEPLAPKNLEEMSTEKPLS